MTEEKGKKREIRQKALRLFQQNGYDHVTINQICSAAGISKNTFYYYYKGKKDLIIASFRPSDLIDSEKLVKMLSIGSPYDQLIEIYSNMARYFAQCGREIVKKMLVANLTRTFSEEDCAPDPQKKAYMEMLRGTYQRAIDAGEIRQDLPVKDLMRCSFTMLMGNLQIWATVSREFDLEKEFLKNYRILIRP